MMSERNIVATITQLGTVAQTAISLWRQSFPTCENGKRGSKILFLEGRKYHEHRNEEKIVGGSNLNFTLWRLEVYIE